jgi:hypothetical protein
VWCGGEENDEREDLEGDSRVGWRRDFRCGREENKWKRKRDEDRERES